MVLGLISLLGGGGGGRTKSVTTVENIVDLSMDHISDHMQECKATVAATQELEISNVRGSEIDGVNLKQMIKLDEECIAKMLSDTELRAEIMRDVVQEFKEKAAALNFRDTDVENNVKNVTKIASKVIDRFHQECAMYIVNRQKAAIKDIKDSKIKNVNLESIVNSTRKCVMNSQAIKRISLESMEKTAQKTDVEHSDPISNVTDAFSSAVSGILGNLPWIALIGGLLIVGLIVLSVVKRQMAGSKVGSQGAAGYSNAMPPMSYHQPYYPPPPRYW